VYKVFKFLFAWMLSFFIAILAIISSFLVSNKNSWDFWLHLWGKVSLKILGIKMSVFGKDNISLPAIVIMNHQSIIDVFTFPLIFTKSRVVFLAKKEIKKIPLISRVMEFGGCIFIDRKRPRKAKEDIRIGLQKLPKEYSLLIFPEGTRSKDYAKMLPFKKGTVHIALQTGLPIIPIGQYGMHEVEEKRNIMYKKGTICFHVGEKIETKNWNIKNVNEYTKILENSVKECIEKAKNKLT
jgi:1-acyl-sn-glycerol-3-phosphate acyltransferase